jgi:hypothetical protein
VYKFQSTKVVSYCCFVLVNFLIVLLARIFIETLRNIRCASLGSWE